MKGILTQDLKDKMIARGWEKEMLEDLHMETLEDVIEVEICQTVPDSYDVVGSLCVANNEPFSLAQYDVEIIED